MSENTDGKANVSGTSEKEIVESRTKEQEVLLKIILIMSYSASFLGLYVVLMALFFRWVSGILILISLALIFLLIGIITAGVIVEKDKKIRAAYISMIAAHVFGICAFVYSFFTFK